MQFIPVTIFFGFLILLVILAMLEQRSYFSRPAGTIFFCALLLGTCLTISALHHTHTQAIASLDDATPITIVGQIHGQIRHSQKQSLVLLNITRVKVNDHWQDSHGILRLSIRHLDSSIAPGDVIQVVTTIRPAHGLRNPGGFDYATFLIRHGITATAWADGSKDIVKLEERGNPVLRQIHHWRQAIRQAALNALDGPSLSIYLAMIIGESGYLTPEVRDNFMASGTTHILSISGSHLALVAIIVFGVIRIGLRHLPEPYLVRLTLYITPTKCAAFATIPPVVFYSALAGGEVPTIRSLIMILVALFATLTERPHVGMRALTLAALFIVIQDPLAIYDISFQLSFLSVLTILFIVQRRINAAQDMQSMHGSQSDQSRTWLHSATKRLLQSSHMLILISVAVTITTLPLVAYHFHQIPWAGFLGNLLIVPFAGIVLIPAGLATAVWVLVTDRTTLPFSGVLDWFVRIFYDIAKGFTYIPYAEYHVASPSELSILVFYAAIAVASWWRRATIMSPRWYIQTIATGCAVVTLTAWVWSPYAGPRNGEIKVSYLDVGQGDAILFQLPGPKIILVDGGTGPPRLDMGRTVIAPYLWDHGITHIDLMVITHPQFDHMGGLAYVIREFSVDTIWTNGKTRDAEFYQQFTAELITARGRQDIKERQVKRDTEPLSIGTCHIHILNPNTTYHSQNDHSIVFRLSCGPHSFLLTGDVEHNALYDLRQFPALNRARVLKVPHHGAATSIDIDFLQQVDPELAIISVGKRNRYGHPSREMLSAYHAMNIPIYRTDRDGAIIVQTMGQQLSVTRTIDLYPRRLQWQPGILHREQQNLRLLFPRLSFWSRPTV